MFDSPKLKVRFPTALPEESLEKLYAAWAKVIAHGESGSVYYHNRVDLHYRLKPLIQDQELFQKFFGIRPIQIIDLESSQLIDDEPALIKTFSACPKDTLFMIMGMEQQFLANQSWLINLLMQQKILRLDISIILFFTIDFTHPRFKSIFAKASSLIEHTHITPLHSEADTQHYLQHKAEEWGQPLDQKTAQRLAKLTQGGIFLLPKQALRHYLDTPLASDVEIANSPEMQLRVQSIWRQLLESEQQVMKAIVFDLPIVSEDMRHSLEFLIKSGWIEQASNGLNIRSKFLSDYIKKKQIIRHKTEIKNNSIWINGVLVDEMFSPREKKVMIYLVQNANQPIKRDQLAEFLDPKTNELSNWALDQIVSRLRKRLTQLGISPQAIQTVYGKGYMFEEDS